MAEVSMPRLSDTMEEGTIASWLKKPGEQIKKGDVIAQIETDKATMDLTAFETGTLEEILAPAGATVAIGQPVARIGNGKPAANPSAGEAEPPATVSEAPAGEAGQGGSAAPGSAGASAESGPGVEGSASPAAGEGQEVGGP